MKYTAQDFAQAIKNTLFTLIKLIKGMTIGLLIILGIGFIGYSIFNYPIYIASCLVALVGAWVFYIELDYARKEREYAARHSQK